MNGGVGSLCQATETPFDRIKLGDTAEICHSITHEDIQKFVQLTGDDNKIHVSNEYAKKTGFKKPVAHGMLSASFISTVIGTKLPGDGALWLAQNLEFVRPVRLGDQITVRAEVTKKVPRLKVIELRTEIFNQNRQLVITGTAKVKIVEPRSPRSLAKPKVTKPVALVIGGTGGIGRAICLALARDGYDVAVHYFQNQEEAEEIVCEVTEMGRSALAMQADITDSGQVENLIWNVLRHLGGVTTLVHSATAKVTNLPWQATKWEDFQKHIDINIKGLFNLVRQVVPAMEEAGNGKIIALSTLFTEGTPPPELLPYITAKSALNGFCKGLAVELAAKGIQVNIVSPGLTETDLIADLPERVRLTTAALTPLKRLALPEDVAGAVSYLASPKAEFVTGTTLRVNGGMLML